MSIELSTSTKYLLTLILFIIIIIILAQYFGKSKFRFENFIPYIAQSIYINIYATPAEYPKYQWLFKGFLKNNIRIINSKGDIVFIPRTTTSIPIRVYNGASRTSFTIEANGLEQSIQNCDFVATTF